MPPSHSPSFARPSRATSSPMRSPTAARTGRSGAFGGSKDGQDLSDQLRYTKFWGVSWAHDGSGMYYSRYPALAGGKGDDAGRPALYFHKLNTSQDADRLVYEIRDHPTRIPQGHVTEDGHYLIITQVEGYEKNGIELLDLLKPGSQAQPLLIGWDALYRFIGSRGDELYFHTTTDAPNGRVIAIDARGAAGEPRTVVPEGASALEEASYIGGRIVASYVEDAHGVAPDLRARRPSGGTRCRCRARVASMASRARAAAARPSSRYTDYLTPRRIYRLDVEREASDAVARAACARLDCGLRHRTGVLQQQGRHARADVHHPPARPAEEQRYAGAALRLRRIQHLAHPEVPAAGAGVARDGRRVRGSESARRRRIRRGVAQGWHARQQAARVR